MANNSGAAILVLLIAGGLIVIALYGSSLVAFGTNILSEINTGIANFFAQVGGSSGLLPTPTPTVPGATPTPTPTATVPGSTPAPTATPAPTSTPAASYYHVTFVVNAPTSNPQTESCLIEWTDTNTGVTGAVTLLNNPGGSSGAQSFHSGDVLRIIAIYSGTGCHLDHYTVSPGGNSNDNPLGLTVAGDVTVTAYFVAN
jgi:hypothetical protein